MKNKVSAIKSKSIIGKILSKYGVYIAFLILFIILSIASDVFLTVTNITNIFRQISVIGVIAVGMTMVIVTGGIDLSVGAILAFSACLAASLSQEGTAQPLAVALIAGVGIGIVSGAFSGVFIALFDVPAFIATLGTMTIVRGIVYVYTNGYPITGVTEAYKFIGRGEIGTIPFPIILYVAIVLIGVFLLHYTKFGRHVFALGGNEKSAIVSGINTKLIKFIVYVISGLTAAIGGILLSSRIQTGAPAGGMGYELDAITAAVVGGASLAGGRGTVLGSVVGMLIIGTLSNGLDLLDVSSYYQQIIKGAIILLAVLSDSRKNRVMN